MPAKRSKPECLTPPKGSDWHMYVVAKSLIDVMPACGTRGASLAWCCSILICEETLNPAGLRFVDTISETRVVSGAAAPHEAFCICMYM